MSDDLLGTKVEAKGKTGEIVTVYPVLRAGRAWSPAKAPKIVDGRHYFPAVIEGLYFNLARCGQRAIQESVMATLFAFEVRYDVPIVFAPSPFGDLIRNSPARFRTI
jgi:hypothetical protein